MYRILKSVEIFYLLLTKYDIVKVMNNWQMFMFHVTVQPIHYTFTVKMVKLNKKKSIYKFYKNMIQKKLVRLQLKKIESG